jgi:hypothetical protein
MELTLQRSRQGFDGTPLPKAGVSSLQSRGSEQAHFVREGGELLEQGLVTFWWVADAPVLKQNQQIGHPVGGVSERKKVRKIGCAKQNSCARKSLQLRELITSSFNGGKVGLPYDNYRTPKMPLPTVFL